jgi:predicted O-methyltransferase YrrM
MSEILPDATARLLRAAAPEGDDVIRAMEAYGESNGPTTVGREVGQLFCVLTRLADADRVFEFGSGYGYSGYWFVRGGAEVVLTDVDSEPLERAREFYADAGVADRARFEQGDAHAVLDRLDGSVDIVLIDHQKSRYAEALEAAREKLSPGGLVIADNAMVSTSIQFDDLVATLEGETRDLNESTRGVADYLQAVLADDAFETTLLPIGEGVAVSSYEP